MKKILDSIGLAAIIAGLLWLTAWYVMNCPPENNQYKDWRTGVKWVDF